MMEEFDSYELYTLQKKHPHLSQRNNWTSREISTGFSSCDFTKNDENISGCEGTRLHLVKPLKSNRIQPLSEDESTRVSKLPALERLSFTKGRILQEEKTSLNNVTISQINSTPLPPINCNPEVHRKDEKELTTEELENEALYKPETVSYLPPFPII